MHSRIFQLSKKKLPKEEWFDESHISDMDMGYHGIDYCSPTDYYKEDLQRLAELLPKEVFKVTGRKIEIVSDGSCLFEQYKKDLLDVVNKMTYNSGPDSFQGFGPFKLGEIAHKIIYTDFLFYMEDWTGGVSTSECLVNYAYYAIRDGDLPKVLYVNGILDYHS